MAKKKVSLPQAEFDREITVYKVTVAGNRLFGSIRHVIGVGVPHPDNKGMNIFLDSLPLNNELVVRLHAPEPLSWPPDGVGFPLTKAQLRSLKKR